MLKIVKGKQPSPVRAVIYGTEGIGKSTLAAQFPKPLILDTEDGTSQIDCDRVVCHDWAACEGAMHEIARASQGYQTVVVDSADWAERHIIEHLLSKDKKRSIEDYGFGKGYVKLAEEVGRLLGVADQLIARGINVVFVAHSKVQRTSPPDQDEGFDRYELKLTKHTAPLFKEWCDLLLFCNYRTTVVEGQDGRMRARGGKERVMHTQRAAAWDAKNRFGLDDVLPMTIEALSPVFGQAVPAEPLFDRMAKYIAEATSVRTLGKVGDRVEQLVSDSQLTVDQGESLTKLIADRHDVIEPQEVTDGVA